MVMPVAPFFFGAAARRSVQVSLIHPNKKAGHEARLFNLSVESAYDAAAVGLRVREFRWKNRA